MADLKVPFASAEAAEALAEGQPEWARDERIGALKAFAATPVETSALFVRHVETKGAPAEAVELEGGPVPGPPKDMPVPEGFAGAAAVVNGTVTAIGLAKAAASAGVRFSSIRSAIATDPAWAHAVLSDPRVQHPDKFFQLTRALYRDGLLLDVPDGVQVEGPVKVTVAEPDPGRAAFWRFAVRAGSGSRAEVAEEQGVHGPPRSPGPSVAGLSAEVAAGEDAQVHWVAASNFSQECGVFVNREAHVGLRAKMSWSLANFGGALTKSLVHTQLAGDASAVNHAEVAFGTRSQRFDLSSFATHQGQRAKSHVLARAAMRHKAKANVKGMITILNEGKEAQSYLGQFALLLDEGAKAVAIPGLEIETSLVTAAKHAAAVSQIDEGQVFYLESRGLPRDLARRLIVEGFLSPAVEGSHSEAFRETVASIVDAQWGSA